MASSTVANHDLREPHGSPWPHYSLIALQFCLLAGPPFRYRRAVAIIGTIALMTQCWLHPNFSSDFDVAQPFSLTWSIYLTTLEKLVLIPSTATTEMSFWRSDMPAREATAYASFGVRKIRWALVLMFNMRGVRWNYEVKNVPKMPDALIQSRARFLLHRTIAAVYYLLMADLAGQTALQVFYTNEVTLLRGDVDSKLLTIRDERSVVWSFVRALTFAVQPYYIIQVQYSVSSIIAVITGMSRPADWPGSFGRLSETTTLRVFWGKYWHQTLRRLFHAWTSAFRDACGMKPGTWQSRYTQLWLSFVISGIGHAASMLILPSPSNITIEERTVGLLCFFVWQAAAITFEDGVKHIWRHWLGGPTGENGYAVRLLGYTWVVGTLWYSIGWAGGVYLRMRLGEQPLFPVTLSGALLQEWVPQLRNYAVSRRT
ncbi:hypothetical protein F5B22DRAFT_394064 [Xylaria bambusicola]|uniref:uncharacterized protein n=1 Tax=Xylaria bambusicola TaxID=326684 RepID=UPI002008BF95|nr:uncharacterized protein F5B22DRAFT_394064 [Xylaria bambusicola]KAI0508608.1 hypothetical protein F5B22DRAFT_394064 [Xylaria bambusicola]